MWKGRIALSFSSPPKFFSQLLHGRTRKRERVKPRVDLSFSLFFLKFFFFHLFLPSEKMKDREKERNSGPLPFFFSLSEPSTPRGYVERETVKKKENKTVLLFIPFMIFLKETGQAIIDR